MIGQNVLQNSRKQDEVFQLITSESYMHHILTSNTSDQHHDSNYDDYERRGLKVGDQQMKDGSEMIFMFFAPAGPRLGVMRRICFRAKLWSECCSSGRKQLKEMLELQNLKFSFRFCL